MKILMLGVPAALAFYISPALADSSRVQLGKQVLATATTEGVSRQSGHCDNGRACAGIVNDDFEEVRTTWDMASGTPNLDKDIAWIVGRYTVNGVTDWNKAVIAVRRAKAAREAAATPRTYPPSTVRSRCDTYVSRDGRHASSTCRTYP